MLRTGVIAVAVFKKTLLPAQKARPLAGSKADLLPIHGRMHGMADAQQLRGMRRTAWIASGRLAADGELERVSLAHVHARRRKRRWPSSMQSGRSEVAVDSQRGHVAQCSPFGEGSLHAASLKTGIVRDLIEPLSTHSSSLTLRSLIR